MQATSRDIDSQVVELLGRTEVASLVLGLDDRADPRRIHQRWTHLRFELASSGAPESDLGALDDVVRAAASRPGERTLLAFAAEGQIRFTRVLERVVRTDTASFGRAEVLPLLEAHQGRVTYLLVVVDRTGADIWQGDWPEPPEPLRRVELTDDVVRPVKSGGWAGLSATRIQNRVLDSWHHNAEAVAAAVVEEARAREQEIVLVGGDTRSTVQVREALPARLADRVVLLRHLGTRGGGGVAESLREQVDTVLAGVVAARVDRAVEQWLEWSGRGHRAVQGWASTTAALSAAEVAMLLVDAGSGAECAQLVRGALVTGATVMVVPPDRHRPFEDGVAALLRHD